MCALLLAAIVATAPAAVQLLPEVQPLQGTRDVLQYDDGTASWLTWGNLHRGVWFVLGDFAPGSTGFSIGSIEFWFYSASTPVPFVARLVDGYFNGNVLAQENMMSSQGTWVLDPPVDVGQSWSVIIDTQPSGVPLYLLGDNTPNAGYGSHSFFSEDCVLWEPWIIQGPEANDYLIRVFGEPILGLECSTWGGIRALFSR